MTPRSSEKESAQNECAAVSENGRAQESTTHSHAKKHACDVVLWILASAVCGLLCGGGAIVLSELADMACAEHEQAWWLTFCLPVCAFLSVGVYRIGAIPFSLGTVDVLTWNRTKKDIPLGLAPCIMVGTALTLLGGGSVGKEAAALQLGGALASGLGSRIAWLRDKKPYLLMAGLAAAFSALLFAPVAAIFFVFEASRTSRLSSSECRSRKDCTSGSNRTSGTDCTSSLDCTSRLDCKSRTSILSRISLAIRTICSQIFSLPTLGVCIASFVAWGLASVFKVGRLWGTAVSVPLFPNLAAESVVVGILSALVGIAFVLLLKLLRTFTFSVIRSDSVRVLIGSVIVVALLCLGGSMCSGTGAVQIGEAVYGGGTSPEAFVWKFVLTILCLGFGLRGGEIMPVLCIGACLGCSMAFMTGTDTSVMSALGMIALFATCTACPLAALALSVEAFGVGILPSCVVAVFCACVFTRKFSLYDSGTWIIELGTKERSDHDLSGQCSDDTH